MVFVVLLLGAVGLPLPSTVLLLATGVVAFGGAGAAHAVAFALDRSASEGRPVQLKEIWQHIKSAG